MEQYSQGSTDIKKALQETVRLDNGRRGYIFTEIPSNNDRQPPRWECHVCGRTIQSERLFLLHLSHPVHASNMRNSKFPAKHFTKFVGSEDEFNKKNSPNKRDLSHKNNSSNKDDDDDSNNKTTSWDVTTGVEIGEPVPPGMEDVVEQRCQLQDTLDNYKERPLVGLEYIIELISSEEKMEPRYACLLCEKRGDPRSVMVHLTSQQHYFKYISCFFRTAGNILNFTQRSSDTRKGVCVAVRKIATQIEKHYGRLKPTIAVAETFPQQKNDILRQIEASEHFRETPQTTFVDLVTADKIKEYCAEAESLLQPLTKYNAPVKNAERPPPKKEKSPVKKEEPAAQASKPKPAKEKPKIEAASSSQADKKLSFQIGKPEKSFGRNTKSEQGNDEGNKTEDKAPESEDDDVIIIQEGPQEEAIISSDSEQETLMRNRARGRSPARNRDRRAGGGGGGGGRGYRDDSPYRSSRRRRYSRSPRSRSRSRSRSRGRYYRRDDSPRRYEGRRHDYRDDRYGKDDRYRRNRREMDDFESARRPRYESPERMRPGLSEERDRRRRSPRMNRSRDKSLGKGDHGGKYDHYRAELKKLELDFETKLKYYENRPEKHPFYNEEWKAFWNKRYKEVQLSGKDPNSYDFKPEWIVFWGKRMRELNDDEFKLKSEELKKKCVVEAKVLKEPVSHMPSVSPVSSDEREDVTVDDFRNTWKGLTGGDLSAPSSNRKRSRSPPWDSSNGGGERGGGAGAHPYRDLPRKRPNSFDPAPPVLHCLRMMSVLENKLGSLGPRVMSLLSRALVLERVKPSESMTLLEDPEIHVFFDTVKEKVRGNLLMGIVEQHLVNSCRNMIKSIDNMLLHHPPKVDFQQAALASAIAAKPLAALAAPIAVEPVQVPGIGMVDKMAVAEQIANALIAQGKTDVSQEELEELINAVVGIAKASNATVTNSTSSKAFFSQLDMSNSTAATHINNLLNSMIRGMTGQEVPKQAPSAPVVVAEEKVEAPERVTPLSQTETVTLRESPAKKEPSPQPKPTEIIKPLKSSEPTFPPDEVLKDKLMFFSTLPREEQQDLIGLLKKLESCNPERVERLRKYVTIGGKPPADEPKSRDTVSPLRENQSDSTSLKDDAKTKSSKGMIVSDDDDDDYSFEDVYKAASEKLMKPSSDPTEQPSSHGGQFNAVEDSNSRTSMPNPTDCPTPLSDRSVSNASMQQSYMSFLKSLNDKPDSNKQPGMFDFSGGLSFQQHPSTTSGVGSGPVVNSSASTYYPNVDPSRNPQLSGGGGGGGYDFGGSSSYNSNSSNPMRPEYASYYRPINTNASYIPTLRQPDATEYRGGVGGGVNNDHQQQAANLYRQGGGLAQPNRFYQNNYYGRQ